MAAVFARRDAEPYLLIVAASLAREVAAGQEFADDWIAHPIHQPLPIARQSTCPRARVAGSDRILTHVQSDGSPKRLLPHQALSPQRGDCVAPPISDDKSSLRLSAVCVINLRKRGRLEQWVRDIDFCLSTARTLTPTPAFPYQPSCPYPSLDRPAPHRRSVKP